MFPFIVLNSNYDFYILDRYISSNLAHQGGKYEDDDKRRAFYKFIDTLEYDLLGLPKADITIFLHMPYEKACELKQNRENLDEHEKNPAHLKSAEARYIELAELYNWERIPCTEGEDIRTRTDIGEEVYQKVMRIKE